VWVGMIYLANAVLDRLPSVRENGGPMRVVLALLADAANRSEEGKLNVLGVFTNIRATEFPARHPQMQMVLELEASAAEVGREKKLEVDVMDEDGEKIAEFDANLTVPPPKVAGQRVHMQLSLKIVDMVFPKSGTYQFSVLIDGNEDRVYTLTVGGD